MVEIIHLYAVCINKTCFFSNYQYKFVLSNFLPGHHSIFSFCCRFVTDACVGITIAASLFMFPSRKPNFFPFRSKDGMSFSLQHLKVPSQFDFLSCLVSFHTKTEPIMYRLQNASLFVQIYY